MGNEIKRWLEGAQKRDKALLLFERGKRAEIKSREFQERGQQFWSQADHLFQSEDVSSVMAWENWQKAENAFQMMQQEQEISHQLFQNALVYDPSLPEAHSKLAAIELYSYVESLTKGNKQQQDKAASSD